MAFQQELVEAREKFSAKQKKLAKVFEESKSGSNTYDFMKATELTGKTQAERLAEVRTMNVELDDIGTQITNLKAALDAEKKASGYDPTVGGSHIPQPNGAPMEEKSIGRLFVESKAYKSYNTNMHESEIFSADVELKTLMQTSAGWAPQAIRTGMVVPFAVSPIRIIDLIPGGTTNMNAVVYMEQTLRTNAAAETAEAGTYGEAALELTERTSSVRKVAVFLPVTDEQLEDIPQIESYINNQLTMMLRQRIDSQIVNGDGSAPNLLGILNNGSIQTKVFAGDRFDNVYDIIRLIRVIEGNDPNVLLFNPTDWQTIRLQKDDDGDYILGSPDMIGPMRLWGLPVTETPAMPVGSVLAGDTKWAGLIEKRGIELNITDSHSDYFINGKKAIRADVRLALPVYRPVAFASLTGF